jgi:ribose-phosphate pyrophosphokinase
MNGELVLFALGGSARLGEDVAAALGTKLAPLEEREFEDGEHKARPLVNVRNRDVVVLHSLHGDDTRSADEKLVRLLFFAGALKDAAASRVTAVVPYLAYARKDRKTKTRDPVTTRYVAQLMEAVGIDRIVALDVHNVAAYQNAFRCGVEHLEAAVLFVRRLAPLLRDGPVAVVSPDSGGVKRAEDFRRRLSATLGRPVSLAFAEKHRSGGMVSGEALVGDVGGATAIIVDDLIASGTTMARAALACRARGALAVYAVATHGVFAAGASEVLGGDAFDRIYVTDSVESARTQAPPLAGKLECVGVAEFLAEAIVRLHNGGSLSELMQ